MTSYFIYSWNINSIRAAIQKRGFLDWFHQSNGDVICLQETKLSGEAPKEIEDLPGYTADWHHAERKGYSGVGTVYRIGYEPLEVSQSIGVDEFDAEGRVLMSTFPEFVIFNVYFPNGKMNQERLDYKMRFYERFSELCKELLEAGKEVIVCGDVNTAHHEIDLANPKSNAKYSGFLPKEREWIDEFLDIGFVDTFRHIHGDIPEQYTWWTQRIPSARINNTGWRIDYFYISKGLLPYLEDATIYPEVKGSDHCPISIMLNFEK